MEEILVKIKDIITYLLSQEGGKNWTLNAETPKYLRDDETYVLNAIEADVKRAEFMSDSLKCNKAFALKAVDKNGLALQYFTHNITGDNEVVERAMANNQEAILFSNSFTKEGILKLLQHEKLLTIVEMLIQLKENCVAKHAVVKACMSEKELIELFDNKDFILAIVKRDGKMLKHASDKLRNDKAVVKAALENTLAALDYVIFQ